MNRGWIRGAKTYWASKRHLFFPKRKSMERQGKTKRKETEKIPKKFIGAMSGVTKWWIRGG